MNYSLDHDLLSPRTNTSAATGLARAGGRARETRRLRETVEPAGTTLRELSGREKEPGPSRLEKRLAGLENAERRIEGQTRAAIAHARDALESSRSRQ
ncbi:DUF7553 family protein [Saliphagus infecundisoli]|uniref:Uncharacterized protein n=1 Tax=Saliphagus infecundisoli TaxID=1849069 RepID=A0ABD5QG87_9EURY|nr:hypothetical protein [Saliphagus infecundisoli]